MDYCLSDVNFIFAKKGRYRQMFCYGNCLVCSGHLVMQGFLRTSFLLKRVYSISSVLLRSWVTFPTCLVFFFIWRTLCACPWYYCMIFKGSSFMKQIFMLIANFARWRERTFYSIWAATLLIILLMLYSFCC